MIDTIDGMDLIALNIKPLLMIKKLLKNQFIAFFGLSNASLVELRIRFFNKNYLS